MVFRRLFELIIFVEYISANIINADSIVANNKRRYAKVQELASEPRSYFVTDTAGR